MPPKKKPKILTAEELTADIESSELTKEEYENIISICKNKIVKLDKDENVSALVAESESMVATYEEKIVSTKALLSEEEEEDTKEQYERTINFYTRLIDLLKNGNFESGEAWNKTLKYDPNEGALHYQIFHSFVWNYKNVSIKFSHNHKYSSYGYECSDVSKIIKGGKAITLGDCSDAWDLDDWYEDLGEAIDTLINSIRCSDDEIDFVNDL